MHMHWAQTLLNDREFAAGETLNLKLPVHKEAQAAAFYLFNKTAGTFTLKVYTGDPFADENALSADELHALDWISAVDQWQVTAAGAGASATMLWGAANVGGYDAFMRALVPRYFVLECSHATTLSNVCLGVQWYRTAMG